MLNAHTTFTVSGGSCDTDGYLEPFSNPDSNYTWVMSASFSNDTPSDFSAITTWSVSPKQIGLTLNDIGEIPGYFFDDNHVALYNLTLPTAANDTTSDVVGTFDLSVSETTFNTYFAQSSLVMVQSKCATPQAVIWQSSRPTFSKDDKLATFNFENGANNQSNGFAQGTYFVAFRGVPSVPTSITVQGSSLSEASNSTAAPTPHPTSPHKKPSKKIYFIIGGAVLGGIVLVGLVVGIVFFARSSPSEESRRLIN